MRTFLIGATLGILAAVCAAGTAFAGAPQSQSLQTTILPTKQSKNTFGVATIHNIIGTKYDNFIGSPAPRETKFQFDSDVKFVNGNLPACSLASLNAANSVAAVQSVCGASIVGSGTDQVNDGQAPYTSNNPALLVSGGPTTLYVWTRIENALTLALTGTLDLKAHTLDVTGIPNTPGIDLTNFDTTFLKKKTGRKTYYIMARCRKKKHVTTETTNFYNGQVMTATSTAKCKQKPSKK